jgi:hypothetical protein
VIVTLLLSGFVHTGRVPLGAVLAVLATPAALAWATRRISGLAMFNVTCGILALSVLGLASTPGGGTFGGLIVLGGAAVVMGIAWIVLLNNALTHDGAPAPLRAFYVGPALAVGVVLVLVLGIPERVRFAASRSALDALAEDPPPAVGEERGALVQVTTEIPSSVGLYDVEAIRVNGPGDEPLLQVVVSGDCGWFHDCTLTYAPDGSDDVRGHRLGDWHANW